MLKPQHLGRYKDIAAMFLKYGRATGGHGTALAEELAQIHPEPVETNGKPEEIANDFERLGPTFIKLGQLLSTRPDFLPQPYLDALSRLQDDTTPIPFSDVRETIEAELGVEIDRVFPELDTHPLACASLGQVHRAHLRDGRRVVVKVQRPGIRQRLEDDLDALTELAGALSKFSNIGRRYRVLQLIGTLRHTLARELDYLQEAQNAHILAKNLGNFKRLVVPKPLDDLSTARVLTMEYLPGAKITEVSPTVLIELDRKALAEELFHAYLQQILVDGIFHADPHPGNLALTRDQKIALMDFGMVVRITPDLQRNLVKLLLAISDGRGDDAARLAEDIGEAQKDYNASEFRRRVQTIVAENRETTIDRLNAGQVILYLQAAAGESGIVLPSEVVMIGKTLMNLDRVVATLHPDFNPNEAMRRHATEIVQQHSWRQFSKATIHQALLEAAEFAQELPRRVNQISRLLAENQLKLGIQAFDETKFIRGLHRVANRITAGLVVAALIVGASLIMLRDTATRIMGYPALAFIFFIMSAIAGVILFWKATFQDAQDEK